jgi:SAM-dependent methyltransferase
MKSGHWQDMAKLWNRVGPPLKPSSADIAVFKYQISQWVDRYGAAPRVLILGVTPELYAMDWPAGTTLRALDNSRSMIEYVWPGSQEDALLGSWEDVPLEEASCDLVLCDGGFGLLPYPSGQQRLLREMRRVLAPNGVFVVRLFAPVGKTGNIDHVFAQLDGGKISSLDALKLHLWGALHGDRKEGVCPRDVAEQIFNHIGDPDSLAQTQGWSVEHVHSLELHRDSTAVYCLTDADEVVRMATNDVGGFFLDSINLPAHEFGNYCPIVALRRNHD